MRISSKINKDWLFALGDKGEYAGAEAAETDFRPINVPHDWSNEYPLEEDAPTGGGGGYGKAGIGWYRKHLQLEQLNTSEEKVFLYFEGVYMDSTVYVNGRKVGGHGYGYSSFYVDITDAVKEGENLLAVRVNNAHAPNSRWYSGAGIQRDVYLVRTGKVHFDHFGVRMDTNGIYEGETKADVNIKARVTNEGTEPICVGVLHKIRNSKGEEVVSSGIALSVDAGDTAECINRPSVPDPHLWSDSDPYLYTLESSLLVDGKVVDTFTCKTGIRTATFDAKKGFLLNGKQVKIKGLCVHHDCGLTGAVGHRDSWERRLKKLKKMGCNGIRCSHNPPVPVLLDLCDELGFLVMDEAFDEWYLSKNKNQNYYSEQLAYGSAMYFSRYAECDLTTMVRRDYNHPSVIIWSIGNEIPEQSSADGASIVKFL
ncbi:MAG: beta-galactosidase, partial [Lachnospiraceae bacterium]|nr:beta-galactosidase [Lachnospiraceae bacterium]